MTVLDVVVRCKNEMPHARRTLQALAAQDGVTARVLFLDCGSTDGSREEAVRAGAEVHDVDPAAYVPGKVLNLGMAMTSSPLVAFVNADAVPLDAQALFTLTSPFAAPEVAASFARQVARPQAGALTRQDYARAFGQAPAPLSAGSFFSMAASAVRRAAWAALPFDEGLRYSEDTDWTHRARALGFRTVYVPETRFEHSHDYDLAATARRRRGEGAADTAIYHLGPPSLFGELLRPLAGAALRDVRAGSFGPSALAVRAAQVGGRFAGRLGQDRLANCDEPRRRLTRVRRPAGYTLSADPAAEAAAASAVDAARQAICAAMGADLRALALAGSYSRGEGGATLSALGALGLHNDLDLVAVVRSGAARWQRRLAPLSERLSREAGVAVDTWAIDEAALRKAPPTLFWLDVALGGVRVLHGDPGLFELAHTPRSVPLDEAGRLLANRAVGLALSNLTPGDPAAARHGHKAILACGDALLLAADRYRPTLRERLAELKRLRAAPAVGDALVDRYAEALSFRARTDLWQPASTLADWYAEVRGEVARFHLAFESWRRGAPGSAAGYARFGGKLYPGMPDVRAGGSPLAALRAALEGRAPLFPYLGHPRERLARAAVALAYAPADPESRAAACSLLGLRSGAADGALASRLRALSLRAG